MAMLMAFQTLVSISQVSAPTDDSVTTAQPSPTEPVATLEYSSFYAEGQWRSTQVDAAGNVYLAGGGGRDFPVTVGPYGQPNLGQDVGFGLWGDVGVVKIDPQGRIIWSTLLGGPKEDYAYVMAVNSKGEVFVGGRAGVGYPTTPGAYDETFNGGDCNPVHCSGDAFMTKLSSNGQLVYSTFIGGSGEEIARAIHLLPNDEVVFAADTGSQDYPTTPGVLMPNHPGGRVNGFISRLSADGSQLLFSTYLGTTNASMEFIFSLAEDNQGNYWFAGSTNGTDLGALQVTANALQPEHGGGDSDMYVGKISPDGRRLLYLTWLGGSGGELIETEGINDGQGNLYIAGWTSSADYPTTVGAYQRQYGGGLCDGFVTKISPDGHLVASTLLGVDDALPIQEGDLTWGPALGPQGNIYVSAIMCADGIATHGAFQTSHRGSGDAFFAIFNPDLSQLLYGSYLGGSGHEKGRFVAVAPDGTAAYLVGHSSSPNDFPQVNPPWHPTPRSWMSYVAKFDLSALTNPSSRGAGVEPIRLQPQGGCQDD
jgi:hypothetical protein